VTSKCASVGGGAFNRLPYQSFNDGYYIMVKAIISLYEKPYISMGGAKIF